MSIDMMNAKVQELRELKRMAAELADEISSIEDAIKAEMQARETDTISGLDWKITWKAVTSSRLDSKALKAELPEVAARFTKPSTARRFVLA